MDVATLLDQTLRAQGIPIVSVRIGTLQDKTTWQVQYLPAATAQHRADGAALLASFDDQAPAVVAAALARQASSDIDSRVVKAVLAMLLDVKLNRRVTAGDGPALSAMLTQTLQYYQFIVNNGL